jgi:hypothetical protein
MQRLHPERVSTSSQQNPFSGLKALAEQAGSRKTERVQKPTQWMQNEA